MIIQEKKQLDKCSKIEYNDHMKLIIGLGNYGEKYEKTRHNYGFLVIDEFARQNNFPEFKLSLFSLLSINGDVILIKPQTYMNNSGKAVRAVVDYYKINLEDIIVVHDDADIDLGTIKEAENKGPAGHNGIKSIIESLGTKNFKRLRMGINNSFNLPLEEIVLKNFSKDEEFIILEKIDEACSILKNYLPSQPKDANN
ncbi:MAG: aminoacyl-tRNA hydrolase [Candidatus Pacebacteria bacterium]|nr:aminoacyl-tRNA hydrolase [Candidatus Paceibacterota bacterium]MDD2757167.1 aminoacyl-tRNA hydrolase [Candidatus Paceibacterota bacterium]MDD3283661.1 aminoacyl-tRNA hydrolase [Candidatus Paceibacterota bacterium]MDD3969715.1 aminoacyl-tRNA hydrolase [Candidatus Paceibacterota bacterium]MDD4737689.1 aminoacyl-tRNA hydrolase [Candidatus Paceibacterota bacterium]